MFNKKNRPFSSRSKKPFQRNSSPFKGSSINVKNLKDKFSHQESKPKTPVVIANNFSDFNLHKDILHNLSLLGFKKPTEIQDLAIPHVQSGKDLIGLANTGTGKTAAFLLPLINKILHDRTQFVLIVVPTRELAIQILKDTMAFSLNVGLRFANIIGGASMRTQIQDLKKNPCIVIGTPGRLIDIIKQGHLQLKGFNNIVLDEADRMLDMGFIADIKYICKHMAQQKQVLLFSASMPTEIKNIIHSFQHDPVTIDLQKNVTGTIEQSIIEVGKQSKMELLHNLLTKEECNKVIIFVRTKHGVSKLEKDLIQRGFKATSIHGDKTQAARQKSLLLFRENKVQILIATDIASRGLDIPQVSHVINFDLPANYDDYTHRIGRTGRAGNTGIAITFAP
ncbi:MAG: DEAD/DEAH box helicase [Methylacidiphilales bacterium]|nr:DEAD/DEAH box helicase [Candidatus Methylacidiphilales bacterium]